MPTPAGVAALVTAAMTSTLAGCGQEAQAPDPPRPAQAPPRAVPTATPGVGGSTRRTAADAEEAPSSSASTRTIAAAVEDEVAKRPKLRVHPRGAPPRDLVVEPIATGRGRHVRDGDLVTINYVSAYWSDGEEIDASWDRKTVFPFVVGSDKTLEGLSAAVRRMRAGDRRLVVMPPRLAYGGRKELQTTENRDETLVAIVDLVDVLPGRTTHHLDIPSPPQGKRGPDLGDARMRPDTSTGGRP